MPLLINLRHLRDKNLELQGELTPAELELEALDELIHPNRNLIYRLTVQKLENNLLIQGTLSMILDCDCARCLQPYEYPLTLQGWVCHLPLEGEDRAVVTNDCVDLTPYLREDILLAFPQHPLCKPECGGLTGPAQGSEPAAGSAPKSMPASSAWAELNKLKFDE